MSEPLPCTGTFQLDPKKVFAEINKVCGMTPKGVGIAKGFDDLLKVPGTAAEGVINMICLGFLSGRVYQQQNPELHCTVMK